MHVCVCITMRAAVGGMLPATSAAFGPLSSQLSTLRGKECLPPRAARVHACLPRCRAPAGVSLFYLAPDGRVREVVEYRQPTREEMAAHLRQDTGSAVVK